MSLQTDSKALATGGGRAAAAYGRQHGAVLIVSLIILLIMTLIGITAVSTTSLEEKMAGNLRDKNVALQAAEAALADGEATLSKSGVQPPAVAACPQAPCVWQVNMLPDLSSQVQTWWLANGQEYGTANVKDINEAKTDPRFIIEALSFVPDNLDAGQGTRSGLSMYRITAHGTGATDDAQSMLVSTFAKRFD